MRDDGPAAGDFLTDELGGDEVGDAGAEILAVADAGLGLLAAQVLADGDIFHLGRDDAGAGVFQLGHRTAGHASEDLVVRGVEARGEVAATGMAVVLGLDLARIGHGGDVAAVELPAGFDVRQAPLDVDGDGRVGIGARAVVNGHRRLIGAGVHRDLAERHADVGIELARHIDLATARPLAGRDGARLLHHGFPRVFQRQIGRGFSGSLGGDVDVHGSLCV